MDLDKDRPQGIPLFPASKGTLQSISWGGFEEEKVSNMRILQGQNVKMDNTHLDILSAIINTQNSRLAPGSLEVHLYAQWLWSEQKRGRCIVETTIGVWVVMHSVQCLHPKFWNTMSLLTWKGFVLFSCCWWFLQHFDPQDDLMFSDQGRPGIWQQYLW